MEQLLVTSQQCPKINVLYLYNERLNLEILFDDLIQNNPKLTSLVCGFVRNITSNIQIPEINNIITLYAEFKVNKYELNIMKQPLYDDKEFDSLYIENIGDEQWDIAWKQYAEKYKAIQNIPTSLHLKQFLSHLNIKLQKDSYDKFMNICTQNNKYTSVSPKILKRIIKVALHTNNFRNIQKTVAQSVERLIQISNSCNSSNRNYRWLQVIKSIFDIESSKTSLNKNKDYRTQYFDAHDMNITNCSFDVESLFMDQQSENNRRHHVTYWVGCNKLKFSIRARALFVCSNVCSEYCEWVSIKTVNKSGMDYCTARSVLLPYNKQKQFYDYWKENVNKTNINMVEWLLFWRQFDKLNEYELKRCYYYLSNGSDKNISLNGIERFVNRNPGGNMDGHDENMKNNEWEGMRHKMRLCFPNDEKYKNKYW